MWNTSTVHEDMKHYLEMGLIDDPVNLKNKRLYVYTGTRNFLFTPSKIDDLVLYNFMINSF